MRNPFEEFGDVSKFLDHDTFVIWLNITGLALIAITFAIIGIMCVSMADRPTVPPRTKRAIVLTKLTGWFLIACALARLVDIVSYWHNYAIFNGWLRVITGLITAATISLIPGVIKEAKQAMSMKEAAHKLDTTKEKLEQVQEINKKLSNDATGS